MRLKYAEDFYIQALLKKVKLFEVMTTPPICVHENAPFRDVVRLLHEKRIRHLPVLNSENEVVGIISQRDLYKLQPPHKNEDGVWVYDLDMVNAFILRNVMTSNPFTLESENILADAIGPMVLSKYGCIPVTDKKKKIMGIITQYDILKLAFQILEEGK